MRRRLAEIELKKKEIAAQRAALEAEELAAAREADLLLTENELLLAAERQMESGMQDRRAGAATERSETKRKSRS